MSDSHIEPHVSAQDLRAALAQNGRSRPNPLMSPEPPAWEWTTDEQAELDELRESVARLEAQVERLRGDVAGERAYARELHDGLRRLAASRPWHRRRVLGDLADRGLL